MGRGSDAGALVSGLTSASRSFDLAADQRFIQPPLRISPPVRRLMEGTAPPVLPLPAREADSRNRRCGG
jgi:hypothetical protein